MAERKEIYSDSLENILSQYPFLKERLTSKGKGLLVGGKRSPSIRERLEMFGGAAQVGQNIEIAKQNGSEKPYIVLLACEQYPAITIDIALFAYHATREEYMFPMASLHITIRNLGQDGFLEKVLGVTYFSLQEEHIVDITNYPERGGYLIVGGGSRKRAELLAQPISGGFFGGLTQTPQPA